MTQPGLDLLQAEIAALSPVRPVGRVAEIGKGIVRVTGLSDVSALGDLVAFRGLAGSVRAGEIVQLDRELVRRAGWNDREVCRSATGQC